MKKYLLGGIERMLANMGLPSFIAYGSLIGELVAPLFIIAGFRTRLAAVVMAFNMIVAVLMVHMGHFFAFTETGGWDVKLKEHSNKPWSIGVRVTPSATLRQLAMRK